MRHPLSLLAVLLVLPAAMLGAAPRQLESFNYFSPATYELTITREQDTTSTTRGTTNAVTTTRITQRDLLKSVVESEGYGKLEDWSLVAYSNSETYDDVADLDLVALNRKNGARVSVDSIRLDTLSFLDIQSSASEVTRSTEGTLLKASFDQKYLVSCEQLLADGTLTASGALTHSLGYGPLKAAGQSLLALKPGALRLVLTGVHVSEAGNGVAKLTLTLGAPRVVTVYDDETLDLSDSGGGVDVSIGGPN